MTLSNDGIHDSSIDVIVETFAVIEKLMAHVKINVPADENDKVYQKEFLRTSIDVKRLFDGVQGNFIFKVFMENFMKSFEVEPKFPLRKVKQTYIIKYFIFLLFFLFQGIYKLRNFTMSDRSIPFPISTKGTVEVRNIGKIEGKKGFVHIYTFKWYGEVQKTIF